MIAQAETSQAAPPATPEASPQPLLLKTADAARLLAISPRLLWTLTKAGEIPAVRLGGAVRYSRAALERYVTKLERRGVQ